MTNPSNKVIFTKKQDKVILEHYRDPSLAVTDIPYHPLFKGINYSTIRRRIKEMKSEGMKFVINTRHVAPKTKERQRLEERVIEIAEQDDMEYAKDVCQHPEIKKAGIGENKVRALTKHLFPKAHARRRGAFGSTENPMPSIGSKYTLPPEVEAVKRVLSPEEFKAVMKSLADGKGRFLPGQTKIPTIDFSGHRIRIGSVSDLHAGSMYSEPKHWELAVKEIHKAKCDMVTVAGDVSTGVDPNKSPAYELTHIGYDSQKERCIEMLSMFRPSLPKYLIDGNHDRWFKKQNGALIVKDVCENIKNATYLGEDEGDISLRGMATLKLWHGEDGSSYALSYRLQKILESLSPGEKPSAIIAGHAHKALYVYERAVHAIGAGSLQRQTRWMRSKRLASHTGFWIIDIWVNKDGISKFSPTFYPFYT